MPDTGRPSKLTPAAKEKVLQALGLGNTRAHAAAYAGIDAATLRRWMGRGRDEKEGSYTQLRQAVLQAESRAQMLATGCIAKAIRDGDWKAAAWMLERRVPEHYAPRSRLFDPHRVLDILEDQGLVVDRDRALQALAAAEPGMTLSEEDTDDLDEIEVSEEERRVLMKVLRASKGESAEPTPVEARLLEP